jgi:hypothetical protein
MPDLSAAPNLLAIDPAGVPASPQAPFIHLNGSGRPRLIEQLTDVHEAATALLEALSRATPHGRDYYPLGDRAFQRARAEHQARIAKVTDILTDVADIRLQLIDRGGGSR